MWKSWGHNKLAPWIPTIVWTLVIIKFLQTFEGRSPCDSVVERGAMPPPPPPNKLWFFSILINISMHIVILTIFTYILSQYPFLHWLLFVLSKYWISFVSLCLQCFDSLLQQTCGFLRKRVQGRKWRWSLFYLQMVYPGCRTTLCSFYFIIWSNNGSFLKHANYYSLSLYDCLYSDWHIVTQISYSFNQVQIQTRIQG